MSESTTEPSDETTIPARTRARATSADVAKLAGVSRTAVSFAYNDPARIGKATRAKILAAAEQLGYSPNPVARMLKQGRTGNLGVLLPQAIAHVMQNPYYAQFLTGLGQVCEQEGLALLLCPPLRNSLLTVIPYAAVDGFVVTGLEADRGEVTELRRRGVPFVVVDSEPTMDVPTVEVDDEAGGYELTKHLLDLGHRRITFLLFEAGPDRARIGYRGPLGQRMNGAIRALKEIGLNLDSLDVNIVEAACTRAGGYEATRNIMSQAEPPTAIIALSDIMAVGALDALQSLGLRIPTDVSVAGYDDQPEAEWTQPKLTTVRQPTEAKGRLAGDFLVAAIRGEDQHPHQRLQGALIVRQSTGPVPEGRRASAERSRDL